MEALEFPQCSYTPVKNTQLALPSATHADYDSYDDWYRATHSEVSRDDTKEQNWQRLRKKYGTPITATDSNTGKIVKDISTVLRAESGIASISQILDSKRDKSGRFVVEVKHDDVLVDLDSVDFRDFEPDANEIQNCAMEYMIEARGNYEDAYALLEVAYADFLPRSDNKSTFNDLRQQLLMEKAMEFINTDPDYVNDASVSSIWEALWHQRQTALA